MGTDGVRCRMDRVEGCVHEVHSHRVVFDRRHAMESVQAAFKGEDCQTVGDNLLLHVTSEDRESILGVAGR